MGCGHAALLEVSPGSTTLLCLGAVYPRVRMAGKFALAKAREGPVHELCHDNLYVAVATSTAL